MECGGLPPLSQLNVSRGLRRKGLQPRSALALLTSSVESTPAPRVSSLTPRFLRGGGSAFRFRGHPNVRISTEPTYLINGFQLAGGSPGLLVREAMTQTKNCHPACPACPELCRRERSRRDPRDRSCGYAAEPARLGGGSAFRFSLFHNGPSDACPVLVVAQLAAPQQAYPWDATLALVFVAHQREEFVAGLFVVAEFS